MCACSQTIPWGAHNNMIIMKKQFSLLALCEKVRKSETVGGGGTQCRVTGRTYDSALSGDDDEEEAVRLLLPVAPEKLSSIATQLNFATWNSSRTSHPPFPPPQEPADILIYCCEAWLLWKIQFETCKTENIPPFATFSLMCAGKA